MWSGSIASIPTGWLLCNGTSGTPNLIDRFVIAAGTTYAVGASGGSKDAIVVSHTHTLTDSGHNHNLGSTDTGVAGYAVSPGTGPTGATNRKTDLATTGITMANAGSSGTNANLPPYYALAYIMKS